MYYVKKTIEVSAAHFLKLSYSSKCERVHGHNWIISIYCKSETLNNDGMIVDFSQIKKKVMEKFDHKFINEVVNFNPTAENLAKWCHDEVPQCYKVEVQESSNNTACYED